MKGRKLDVKDAKRVLREKGCSEIVLELSEHPKSALTIPRRAQERMGIKSWGLVDFLRGQGVSVIRER